MYNKKILKYEYKLNSSSDYMKKNIYKSKLNYYKLHNQIGGAAAAEEDPDKQQKFMQELKGILVEKELIKIMNRFHGGYFKFKCPCDTPLGDHTKCFREAMEMKKPIQYLVLQSYIDLDELMKFLDVFRELRSLKIAWGDRRSYGISYKLNIFPELEEIDCSNTWVQFINTKLLQLKKLNISNTLFSGGSGEFLPPNIEELNCFNCRTFSSMPNLKKLVKLDCSACVTLTTLPSLPSLEILIMTDTKISDVSHLFNQLNELDCSNCDELDLSQSHLLKNIEKLNLSDTGIKQLPPEMPLCKELNISNCYMIQDLPDLPLCEKLNIANCGIQEFYIHRIIQGVYENLTTVYVSKKDERKKSILEKAPPHLKIDLVELELE